MRNLCIDRLRAQGPATETGAALEAVGDGRPGPRVRAEGALVAAGEAKRIADCFGTLEPDRAAAVRGAYLDGLSMSSLRRGTGYRSTPCGRGCGGAFSG